MTVKNRLAMAPIDTLYSSLDGAVRQEFKDFIIARAQGGVGMIMLADAGFGFTSLEATVDPALLKGMMKAARELVGAPGPWCPDRRAVAQAGGNDPSGEQSHGKDGGRGQP